MVCKEEGDRFFRKPVLVLGFHPYLSPYVVHLCCALFVAGEPCRRGDGRLFATDDKPSAIKFYLNGRGAKEEDEVKGGGGEPACRMYDTCPLDEIQDLKVS